MLVDGKEINFFLNVNDTRAHYVGLLLSWIKKEETRTLRAYNAMARYLENGMIIGIVDRGMILGYMTYNGVRYYGTREEFDRARSLHCVPGGSEYDYDDSKKKVGLLLSSPVRLASPVKAPESKWRGFRIA